jgi:hypothetical protein
MPSALLHGGTEIRFQIRKHAMQRYFIGAIHLFGHGAPILQQ